ncbi:MAG: hypothetical protein GXP63_07285 [DPANN group archaeon]|nr:hypothetical protein [DPANN group archaeon]
MTNKEANQDEQVGFHKGSLSVLIKERQEMMKILQVVEQLMQVHITALKELGIDLEKEAKALEKTSQKKKPIEDMLK